MIINPQPICEINLTKIQGFMVRDFSLTSDNKYACISSEENGFGIIDVSDHLNPVVIHQENFKSLGITNVCSVLVVKEYLVVVDRY